MKRYHVNPKTGNPNICRVVKGVCPFGDTPHYDSKAEALYAIEVAYTEKHGGTFGPAREENLSSTQKATLSAVARQEETPARKKLKERFADSIDRAMDGLREFRNSPGFETTVGTAMAVGILAGSVGAGFAAYKVGDNIANENVDRAEVTQVYHKDGVLENHRTEKGADSIDVRLPNGESFSIKRKIIEEDDSRYFFEVVTEENEGETIQVTDVHYLNKDGEEKVVENVVLEDVNPESLKKVIEKNEGGARDVGSATAVTIGAGGLLLTGLTLAMTSIRADEARYGKQLPILSPEAKRIMGLATIASLNA